MREESKWVGMGIQRLRRVKRERDRDYKKKGGGERKGEIERKRIKVLHR